LEVLISVLLPGASAQTIHRFIGWRGAFNLLCVWPLPLLACLFDESSWDAVKGISASAVGGLCGMAALSVTAVCNSHFHTHANWPKTNPSFVKVATSILIALGITWTSPIFIRVGATLGAPAAIAWDLYLGHIFNAILTPF